MNQWTEDTGGPPPCGGAASRESAEGLGRRERLGQRGVLSLPPVVSLWTRLGLSLLTLPVLRPSDSGWGAPVAALVSRSATAVCVDSSPPSSKLAS